MEILGIHPGALGDVVLFGQFLQALREHAGGRVRLVAGGEKARLLAGMGVVDEAGDFDVLPMQEVFSDVPPRGCTLSARLGCCRRLVSCFAAGDARARRRLAAMTSAEEAIFLPVRPPRDYEAHLLDLWAGLSGLGSIRPARWEVPPAWSREARAALAASGAEADAPYVLIHPGSGSRQKCWPLERFRALARALGPTVFVVGPTEQEWWAGRVLADLRRRFPVVVSPSLATLAGLIAAARAFVGNDSGPTHLAAAVGTPTVALFGPSDPRHFGPRGRRVGILVCDDLAYLEAARVAEAVQNV